VLVPPAPRALSNSDLVIWLLPLPSICENRSCRALDGLVDVDVVVAVDDWLCAASSALIVDGDICENPLVPEAGAGVADVEVLLEVSNGFVELWVKPVACGDDDFTFVWVSDLKASIRDDAAPRASSIAELRKMPHRAAVASTPIDQQAPCHSEKPNKIRVFAPRTVTPPRQLMPLRQNFPPIDVPRMLLSALGSALRAAVLALSAADKEQIAPPKRGGPPNQD
jgi:hypothetical protein